MAGLEAGLRGRDDVRLVHAQEIIDAAPPQTRRASQPLKWTAKIPVEDGRVVPSAVIADDLFALRFADNTESYFLVEIDRGQMPVRRSANVEEIVEGKKRMRTYFMHKLATYWHGWRQGRHMQQFGVEQIRVLTITTSAKRIETMLDALRDVTDGKGSEMFLFIDEEALRERNPIQTPWVTGKGRTCHLTK